VNELQQAQNDILRLQRQLQDQEDRIAALQTQVAAPAAPASSPLGSVLNFLRNGDLSFSENHYDVAPPPSGTNTEREAAYFYTHAAGTVALVDSSANALSSTGHTVNNNTGTADPQWNRVDGHIEWGSLKSIDCPLPKKMAQPSKQMICGLVARKKNGSIAIPAGLTLGLGFHDNTAGQQKYLTGGAMALTATLVGIPGATTSRKYKVVATTDWGETYESNEVTLAGAPSNSSYITNSVYVRLDWTQIKGVDRYDIYRLTGATYVLAGQIFNGAPGFNEQNNFLAVTITGYPTTSGTNARAYVQIKFDDLTTDWQDYRVNVPVPQTYDTSVTTDKQWLRLTLSSALAAGSEQGIQIDKIYVAWVFGKWAPAPDDSQAKQDVDTSAVSGTQGPGDPGDPPVPGTGGHCPWELAPVAVYEGGEIIEILARDVTLAHQIVSFDDEGRPMPWHIEEILEGTSSMLCTVITEDGAFGETSPDHPHMQGLVDDDRRRAVLLRKDDRILTFRAGQARASLSCVLATTHLFGRFKVRMFRLRRGHHLFVVGGCVGHNLKPQE
jgi:hypothetical protein